MATSKTAFNLLTQMTNEFKGDTLVRVASAVGEDSGKTSAALSSICPALIGSLANKASTADGAGDIVGLIRENHFDTAPALSSAASSPTGITGLIDSGRSLLGPILGGRTNAVTDYVAQSAGINRGSAMSLLSMAAPVLLGLIGRRLVTTGLSGASISTLLGNSASYIKDLPGGLIRALGLGGPAVADQPDVERFGTAAARPVIERHGTPATAAPLYAAESTGSSWWKYALPLLLLAGLIGLFGYFLTRRGAENRAAVPSAPAVSNAGSTASVPAAPAANPPTAAAPSAPTRTDLGAFLERKLPDGTTINVPGNGVESKLVAFIEDKSQAVDKETWFSFDRLEFETDSAKLKPSSQEQLRNISNILKAYPGVNVKIGGYTDNTGNAAHNLKLSGDRANTTMNELASLGIAKARMAAEGYGDKHPIADNATEEGKQRNRRIDIRVTKK